MGGSSFLKVDVTTVPDQMFTTLKLADANLILIGQFGVTLVLNSVLLVQSLVWD